MFEFPLLSVAALSFVVIFAAEFGDKSQIVCMTLAAQHRPLRVFLGAASSFALLNLLAVTLGSSLASWLPEILISVLAAALFGYFGVQSLRNADEDDEELDCSQTKPGRSVFLSTFSMIFVAELGDKTQIATATMSTTESPLAVWLGATSALIATSAIGVVVGNKLIARVNPLWLHRVSGALFLLMAVLTVLEILL
ncbi:TMEM165/GDT1 family protein [Aliagarivorans taiwanensis]|uniref:TMEM165/GDT1 family protein n=1 Tax=Aliagarivorans taiwanensis TaxID=561966 RepID=UPI000423894B|nr:TMEM165/GDT1 family protein [Aliagarivorans taiwanensis]